MGDETNENAKKKAAQEAQNKANQSIPIAPPFNNPINPIEEASQQTDEQVEANKKANSEVAQNQQTQNQQNQNQNNNQAKPDIEKIIAGLKMMQNSPLHSYKNANWYKAGKTIGKGLQNAGDDVREMAATTKEGFKGNLRKLHDAYSNLAKKMKSGLVTTEKAAMELDSILDTAQRRNTISTLEERRTKPETLRPRSHSH